MTRATNGGGVDTNESRALASLASKAAALEARMGELRERFGPHVAQARAAVLTLPEVRDMIASHTKRRREGGGAEWTDAELVALLSLHQDLQHDAALLEELMAFPTFVGRLRVVREARLPA